MSPPPWSTPGAASLRLSPADLLIRGALAGAILAAATSLALTGIVQTGQPLVGALIFPVGLILIVLLGLDLVTGSFGLLPLPWLERDAAGATMLANWGYVFIGNLIGSVAYGGLLAIALTNFGTAAPAGVAAKIIAVAEAKTVGYAAIGYAGLITVFVKAMLCNWMVCLAIVAAMTTNVHHRQNRDRLHAGVHLLRAGLRAFRREHVHHPDRHDDGRQGDGGGLVVVESDSGDARQSGRRCHLHGARDLSDTQTRVRPRPRR